MYLFFFCFSLLPYWALYTTTPGARFHFEYIFIPIFLVGKFSTPFARNLITSQMIYFFSTNNWLFIVIIIYQQKQIHQLKKLCEKLYDNYISNKNKTSKPVQRGGTTVICIQLIKQFKIFQNSLNYLKLFKIK